MPVSYYGDLSGESSSDDIESSSDDDESFSGETAHQALHDSHVQSPPFTSNSHHVERKMSPNGSVGITDNIPPLENLWSRCILHLDIDCFYCQCEELDRNLTAGRPLAIGQKHIIVTCNYEARRYGVKKLQLRESAMAACPHLWIVEGSDLLQYKRHSRKVYEAFRLALEEIAAEIPGISIIPAKKGCMDEMMADLSEVVNQMLQRGTIPDDDTATTAPTMDNKNHDDCRRYYQSNFVYGDSDNPVTLVEDQTGQTTTVTSSLQSSSGTSPSKNNNTNTHSNRIPLSRRNVHDNCYDSTNKREQELLCSQRLHLAGRLVARVCRRIVQETGFYTTGGISVSPLLAKLASDLNKPKSINLLYPWRSSPLLYSMPLRKLHGLGRSTMKALDPCLASSGNANNSDVKTVLDLLQVPDGSIARCLQSLHAYHESGYVLTCTLFDVREVPYAYRFCSIACIYSSTEQCNLLIQRCRGWDVSEIVDDQGGLPKTVSIENSFRKNTITTQATVQRGLDDLLHRLPFLLNDRTSWARDPELAYPTTIRVTVRLVDQNLVLRHQDGTTTTEAQRRKGRRPYVTTSRQSSLTNGKALVLEKDTDQQSRMLRKFVEPLLEQLLSKAIKTNTINLTRLNIALANFQDTVNATSRSHPTTSSAAALSQAFFGSQELGSKRASGSIRSIEWATPNQKKARTETFAGLKEYGNWNTQTPSSRLSQSSTSTPTLIHQIPSKSFASTATKSKSNRMKPTTIDNFFCRKPK